MVSIIESHQQEGLWWKCHQHAIYGWDVIKVTLRKPIIDWYNDCPYRWSRLMFFIHQWLRCKSFWIVDMCRDFYVNQCLISFFFFLCYIVGYPCKWSFHFFVVLKVSIFVKLCYFFVLRQWCFPNQSLFISFVAWKGLCFVKLCSFYFLVSKVISYQICQCFYRDEVHHFLWTMWIFFVASSGSWSFYNFIAILLICHCCCNLFLVPFDFLSLLPLLIFICFCCLSHCRCWQSIVTWLLFKLVGDIHMVNGLLLFFFSCNWWWWSSLSPNHMCTFPK
jgi:hypothetical protein